MVYVLLHCCANYPHRLILIMKKTLLLSCILAVFFTCTWAQEVIISGETLYNSNFSIINSSIIGSPVSKKKKSAPLKTSTLASLVFNRSEAASKKLQENFIAQLSTTQPAQKKALQQLFADNKLRTQFDDLLAGYGYSARNLADVMTAYLVINWQVVHGSEFNDKKGFDAVRKMITETLTSGGKLAAASNLEKQTLAETFGYQSIIAMQTYKAMKATGNEGLPALQDAIYKNTKAAGVDLKKYLLTANGFVSK